MDLHEPTVKMGQSAAPAAPAFCGCWTRPDVIRRKIARAVTDSGGDVTADPVGKPGVANLLTILAAATRITGGGRGAAGYLPAS